MYERKFYQEQVTRFAGTPLIKVLTGMRRVGKSTVMRLFRADLIKNGVTPERIIYIDIRGVRAQEL